VVKIVAKLPNAPGGKLKVDGELLQSKGKAAIVCFQSSRLVSMFSVNSLFWQEEINLSSREPFAAGRSGYEGGPYICCSCDLASSDSEVQVAPSLRKPGSSALDPQTSIHNLALFELRQHTRHSFAVHSRQTSSCAIIRSTLSDLLATASHSPDCS